MSVTTNDYHLSPPLAVHGPTLPDLFRAAVDARGDAVAVDTGTERFSWLDWRAHADALACALQDWNVTSGEVVVAQLPNGWDFLVTHVAVASIGAVLLPAHPYSPPGDVAALAKRAGARTAVLADAADPALLTGCPDLRQIVVAGAATTTETDPRTPVGVTSLAEVYRSFAARSPEPVTVRPGDPFVLIASSGTTSARPKICVHTHEGLLANAAAVARADRSTSGDTLVSASPFSHLFGLLSVHLSLTVGARQVPVPRWDADSLLALTRSTGPTVLYAVPAQLRDLLARMEPMPVNDRPHLRLVRTGGAAVPATLVTGMARLTGARVVVQWGMSEVGAGLFTDIDDAPDAAGHAIGRPVDGAQVRVVDTDGQACAAGVVGELEVRSPYQFRGYLGEPELSAAAMRSSGWLRTADLAGLRPDGTVDFRGRAAEQINVGGRKVNALEIEQALAGLAGLGEAAVVGRPDERLGEYPCLVRVDTGRPMTLAVVIAHLAANGVAEHAWPAELVTLAALPHTASGKVARRRLILLLDELAAAVHQAPPSRRPDPREEPDVQPAATPTVELVMALAAEQLGQPIGPQDTFRDSGVTSLGAVRLVRALGSVLGRDLPSTLLFDHPTPARLVAAMAGAPPERHREALPAHAADEPGGSEPADDDPVVVVGMACRLPGGAHTPDAFWTLLLDERDAVVDFPTDRGWPTEGLFDPTPGRPGRTYCRSGGFLDDVAGFDAAFFGITPSEAVAMDPQQRILLEVTWEAMEDAGLDAAQLRDSDTGVFLGMMASDYAPRLSEDPGRYDGQLLIGNSAAVASGRIAYLLGLRGPVVTLDTACSSSLVALHQASRALRGRECDRAFVAGVAVMSTAAGFVDFSRQSALAPDGRCKAFGADADGAGWSEGAAVLVLERLSKARRDGHRVLAVVLGSAVNADGASNGLTAPSGLAQQELIRRALADARLRPGDVDAVEAHGTGTPLGDPIEVSALLATYGRDRDRRDPLYVGSVKSNLGHTQAAAGLVGVVKAILALQHAVLPKTLHAWPPSPHVDWSGGTVELLQAATPWPTTGRPRRIGVSAFGIGGTNAHVVLEQAPTDETPAAARSGATPAGPESPPLPLSAPTPTALPAMAARLRDTLAGRRPDLADVAHTLAWGRTAYAHRAVVLPDSHGDYQPALDRLAAGLDGDDVARGTAVPGATVFVFPGHGAHWTAMGRELLAESAPFAEAVQAIAEAFEPHLGWSLPAVLRGDPQAPALNSVDVVQPALFAMMVATAQLWRAAGVRPDAVIGHSQGEVAAAYIAGALSLADAARVVVVRSRALLRLAGRGAMVAVPLPPDQIEPRLRRWRGAVSVAAINGPRSTVVAGTATAIEELTARLTADGVSVRPLAIDVAAHCAGVDELLPEVRAGLERIRPTAATIPFVSTVDGAARDTSTLDADYWCRNLREPVRLHPAVSGLVARGSRHFVQVGAHPVLGAAIEQTADDLGTPVLVYSPAVRGDATIRRLRRTLAQAQANGVGLDREMRYRQRARRLVPLPTYPFRHRRYWPQNPLRAAALDAPPPVVPHSGADAPPRISDETDERQPDRHTAVDDGVGPAGLTRLVRRHASAVAGFPDDGAVPADARFTDLGFGSLALADLGRRLSAATGLALPGTVAVDHPTPAALAGHLATRRRSATGTDDLAAMYRDACRRGLARAALTMVVAAAQLREDFGIGRLPPITTRQLATGPAEPPLVLVPSITPLGGPAEFDAWRTPLSGVRDAVVVAHPGFAAGEPVPRDLDALLAAHAAALVRDDLADVVLCGHSSGGWLAHALAHRLLADGHHPAGVVLVDALWPDDRLHDVLVPRLWELLSRGPLGDVDTGRLTAAGQYLRLMRGWEPPPSTLPTLLVTAQESLFPDERPTPWQRTAERVTVAGDHLTMMSAHGSEVVAAVQQWLTSRDPARSTPTRAVAGNPSTGGHR